MTCDAFVSLQMQSCLEWNTHYLADQETDMSTASTEDMASDGSTDDDEAPPMVPLERNITLTEYNECRSREWQDSEAAMPRFESNTLVGMCLVDAVAPCVLPSLQSYPAPLSMPHSTGGAFCQSFHSYNAYSQERQPSISVPKGNASLCAHDAINEEDKSEWCDRLMTGGEQRQQVLAALRGKVAELAFQQLGCRIVQKALDVAGTDAARVIVAELHGHVQAAAWSPHANYVIQKVIAVLPPSECGFVARELQGVASSIARSKYGCRILCRIFEHALAEPESTQLADELLRDAVVLCRHIFAHHVMEVIVEHGFLEQRRSVVKSLAGDFWVNAQGESSSYVIQCAMVHCTEDELENLLASIPTETFGSFGSLLSGKPGMRVLRAMSRMQSPLAKNVLRAVVEELQRFECQRPLNWHGKRFVLELTRGAGLSVSA